MVMDRDNFEAYFKSYEDTFTITIDEEVEEDDKSEFNYNPIIILTYAVDLTFEVK